MPRVDEDEKPESAVRRLLTRAIRGKDDRPTRFHDQSGQRIGPRAWGNFPLAFASFILHRIAGFRQERPWISFTATKRIDALIQPNWKAIEFGSGMSTLWLARRCGLVHSIESDAGWHGTVQDRLAARGATNVTLHLRQDAAYEDLSAFPDCYFDVALVDGIRRAECCRSVVPKMKPGGWVYLDNSDRAGANPPSGDLAEAKVILLRAAADRGGSWASFVDFVPTSLVVSEGLLVRL